MRLSGRIAQIAAAVICCGAAAVMSSCNSGGCTENQTSVPRAGFYDMETLRQVSLTGVEIGGIGAPNDSLLATGLSATGEVYLPLRANKATTSFYFRYLVANDSTGLISPRDTLTVDYNTLPYFASEACGAMYRYTITRITHTSLMIDSVALTDSVINNLDIERLKIFFKDNSADEDENEDEENPFI